MTTAPPTLADLRRLPGASTYRVANAAILLARKALKLEDQFELTFEDWGPGNRVYDWYKGLRNPNVQVMHLRKERASPFYHEFIALQLKDGTFWRIDRRQRQDEPTPINCIQPKGVAAFDTIEQVNGLGLFLGLDPLSTGASNSMIELEFKQDVDVGLVLRICRAIKEHTYAKVYTLQRYNCFFFAQTVVMCTACGASDWAGRGELAGDLEGPWKSPNAPLNYSWSLMENASRSKGFVWKPTESFGHDWDELSKQSSAVVRTSLALMHADHCDLCLASKTPGQLRSLSMEINRFKQELVEYWDQEYCQLLAEAYRMNHEKLVNSGIWGIITGNMAREDCEDMLQGKLADIQIGWDEYSKQRLAELLRNVSDILDPKERCENWHVDPDEWGSSWNCKDGGPVKPAREKWERDVIQFIDNEFIKLEKELKDKTTQNSFDMHAAAKRARIDSFQEAMTIKLRTLDEDEFLKPMQPGTDPLGKKLPDVETVRTKRTAVSAVSSKISKAVTKRATKIKNRMRRLFKASHQLETADIMQMERRIRVFLQKHGENLNLYRPWLKCTSEVVQADMKRDMNEVWNCIIR